MEESKIKKRMENPRLHLALESVIAMWRIKDKPTSTDCYESFRQISRRENIFCITRRQYGNYLNTLEGEGLIKTDTYSRGRKGVKTVVSVPNVPRKLIKRSDLPSGVFHDLKVLKRVQTDEKFAENLYDDFEPEDIESGAISMSIWEFMGYLEQYKDLKRGFDLDGVVNSFYWDEKLSYDEYFDLNPEVPEAYSLAKSTEFAKMLRPSDCIISARPLHWEMETRKWLIDHEVLARNICLRPARYKSSKNESIIFKAATIEDQGVKIYLDDERGIANGVKNVLPDLVTCYLDIRPSTTQIILRY